MSSSDGRRKIVRLNVGGTRYDVARDTLERCEGSMLAKLISERWNEGRTDDKEVIFIDHNGRLFEFVLDYLRNNKVYLSSSISRAAIKDEFEYYGIDVDMGKVVERYGMEYTRSLAAEMEATQRNLFALRNDLTNQALHLKESKFLNGRINRLSLGVILNSFAMVLAAFLIAYGLLIVSSSLDQHARP